MGDVVVIKFGGGLITNKSQMCTPELETIDNLVGVVKQCIDTGLSVIVVHGAGSYGHLNLLLNEGLINDGSFTPQVDCNLSPKNHKKKRSA